MLTGWDGFCIVVCICDLSLDVLMWGLRGGRARNLRWILGHDILGLGVGVLARPISMLVVSYFVACSCFADGVLICWRLRLWPTRGFRAVRRRCL